MHVCALLCIGRHSHKGEIRTASSNKQASKQARRQASKKETTNCGAGAKEHKSTQGMKLTAPSNHKTTKTKSTGKEKGGESRRTKRNGDQLPAGYKFQPQDKATQRNATQGGGGELALVAFVGFSWLC